MYTLCPHCSTCFRITTEQVNAAQGNVRCGNCGAVFNALDNPGPEPDFFTDPEFETRDNTAPDTDFPANPVFTEIEPPLTGPEKPDYDQQSPQEKNEQEQTYSLFQEMDFIPLGETEKSSEHAKSPDHQKIRTEDKKEKEEKDILAEKEIFSSLLSETTVEDSSEYFLNEVDNTTIEELEKLFLPDEPEHAEAEPAQEPVQKPSGKKKIKISLGEIVKKPAQKIAVLIGEIPRPSLSLPVFNPIILSAGSLLLILLLLGQYIYFARDYLAQQHPGLRPLLEKMCVPLGCKIPLQRDLDKLQLTHRDVRTHPLIPDALLINATFINKAPFPQPYPAIELKLSNLSGKLVGKRLFQPKEYLSGNPDISAGIAPDTQVYLVLELADPGKQAINFEFNFR